MTENIKQTDLMPFINTHDKLRDYCWQIYCTEKILLNDDTRYFYLVSLISADHIVDIESTQAAFDKINFIKDNIFYMNLSDDVHKETMQFVNKGIRILKRELKKFKKNQ